METLTWVKDDNGNKCSVEFFGSLEKAQKALDSLKDCKNCTDCTDCTRCLRCSACTGCVRCIGCTFCNGCSDCSACVRCNGCSDCSACVRCIDCTLGTFCLRFRGCTFCNGCSDCDYCHKMKKQNEAPKIENIHSKVYAAASQEGALDMDDWHTCETTHCRAGWVVHLAGKAGKELEAKTNTPFAAMQIYKASGYRINPNKFYVGNEEALADMKALAENEKG